jgi:hypothetical protein
MERPANGSTGYPPGSIAERRYREEMEQSFESMGAALDNIRAICRDVAGVDAGSATESVRVVADRARKWAEAGGVTDYPIPDVSHVGKRSMTDPEMNSVLSKVELWANCGLVHLSWVVHFASDPGAKGKFDEMAEATRDKLTRIAESVGAARWRFRRPSARHVWDHIEGWKEVGPAVSPLEKPPGTMTRDEFVEAIRSGIENGDPMGDPAIEDDDDDSQDGNPDPLESMYDAWVALQLVIARIETVACYHSAPDHVLRAILAGCDDVKVHLDAAMGEAEDAAGIEPGEPD